MRRPLVTCILLCKRSLLAFPKYEGNFVFFFISVVEIIIWFFVQVNKANLWQKKFCATLFYNIFLTIYLRANQTRNRLPLFVHRVEGVHVVVEEGVRLEGRRIVPAITGRHLVPQRVAGPQRLRSCLVVTHRDRCHHNVIRHIVKSAAVVGYEADFDLRGFAVAAAGAQDADSLQRLLLTGEVVPLEGGGRVGGGGRPYGQVLAALAAHEQGSRAPGRWLSIKGCPRTRGNHNLSVVKSE
jgi:hypothetical protein